MRNSDLEGLGSFKFCLNDNNIISWSIVYCKLRKSFVVSCTYLFATWYAALPDFSILAFPPIQQTASGISHRVMPFFGLTTNTHQIRRRRWAARSLTSHGRTEPLGAIIESANLEVSEGKLISDHGHFSSYEGHMERRTGQDSWGFSRMHRAVDGWMLARAPASPAQGLHHHGPRYFNFPYFCTMCGLEKLGLLLIKTGWNVFVRFGAENAGRG